MTEDNFKRMTANHRAMWSKAGINTRDEAESLVNEMLKQERVDGIDHAAMMQAVRFTYDDDYNYAKELMAGRWTGVAVAEKDAQEAEKEGATWAIGVEGAQNAPGNIDPGFSSDYKPVDIGELPQDIVLKNEKAIQNQQKYGGQ
jgi:hypothetical protein